MIPTAAPAEPLNIEGVTVRLSREDITELEVDGFVYYAQPDLALGSGTGGAIAMRGGASIQKELDALTEGSDLTTGEAVVTAAGRLPAQFIIHAVGPRFREEGIREKLTRTVLACLNRADEKGMSSLAFPLMGAGYYGIPPGVSAEVMLEGFASHLQGGSGLKEIYICVLDTPQHVAVEAAMAALG